MVEVGQHIVAASVQGTAELSQFLQPGGHTASQGVDDAGKHRLAAPAVGLAVGGDDGAKWLRKFPEAVLTAIDADGYAISVRVQTSAFDAGTGEVPVPIPFPLIAAEGPANLAVPLA